MLHHQLRCGEAADILQPACVASRIQDPLIALGDPLPCQHRQLGAEARSQPEPKSQRDLTALGQVQVTQVRIGLLEVGDRRYPAILQGLEHHSVLNACSHRMTGKALGIGHDHLARGRPEGGPEALDLGRSTPTLGRGIGLVTHEHRAACKAGSVHTGPLHSLFDERVHLGRNVSGV